MAGASVHSFHSLRQTSSCKHVRPTKIRERKVYSSFTSYLADIFMIQLQESYFGPKLAIIQSQDCLRPSTLVLII